MTVAIPNPDHPSPSVLGGISLVQRLKEGKALNKMKLIEINIVWTICHLFKKTVFLWCSSPLNGSFNGNPPPLIFGTGGTHSILVTKTPNYVLP